MDMLFDDPAFRSTEEELKGRDPKQYVEPGDEENYSLLASKDDPVVKAARSITRKRRNRIKKRLYTAKRRRVENCEFGLAYLLISIYMFARVLLCQYICSC